MAYAIPARSSCMGPRVVEILQKGTIGTVVGATRLSAVLTTSSPVSLLTADGLAGKLGFLLPPSDARLT